MAILEVKDISKSFGTVNVIRDVSFSLEKGEVLVIIGPSGGGKTTLLRTLNFLETPEEGSITINDERIFDAALQEKKTEAEVRENRLHFGLVFQQFNLFPQYNVMQNVTLAAKLLLNDKVKKKKRSMTAAELKAYRTEQTAAIEENALRVLTRVGLEQKVAAYPCELSGGQQQRVAIARALCLKPDILCFDEPTSALDPELTGEVLKVIKGLKDKDSTMIVVTHEMEFARNIADKVIFMCDGTIEEMGTADEVFGAPKSEKTKAFLKASLERLA